MKAISTSRSSQRRNILVVLATVVVFVTAFAKSQIDPSALLQAANKGETDLVRQMITQGADPNQKDAEGRSVLTYAASGGHADTIGVLLSLGADPNGDHGHTLWSACTGNYLKVAQVLITAGANVNSRASGMNSTPLRQAVHLGNLDLASYLLEHGADPNLADSFGFTPLMLAASQDSALVEVLVRGGAKVDLRDSSGVTALMLASRAGKTENAKALISAGSDVNAKDSAMGMTALHLAASGGHADLVRALLKAGADPNSKATKRLDVTPLMSAARAGSMECVTVLLKGGANPKAVDCKDNTALMYAAVTSKEDVLVALVHSGIPINAANKKGETALFAAYQSSNLDAVNALLKLGASSSMKDSEGKLAADYFMEPSKKSPPLKE